VALRSIAFETRLPRSFDYAQGRLFVVFEMGTLDSTCGIFGIRRPSGIGAAADSRFFASLRMTKVFLE
jgi:hypothetical protein